MGYPKTMSRVGIIIYKKYKMKNLNVNQMEGFVGGSDDCIDEVVSGGVGGAVSAGLAGLIGGGPVGGAVGLVSGWIGGAIGGLVTCVMNGGSPA